MSQIHNFYSKIYINIFFVLNQNHFKCINVYYSSISQIFVQHSYSSIDSLIFEPIFFYYLHTLSKLQHDLRPNDSLIFQSHLHNLFLLYFIQVVVEEVEQQNNCLKSLKKITAFFSSFQLTVLKFDFFVFKPKAQPLQFPQLYFSHQEFSIFFIVFYSINPILVV